MEINNLLKDMWCPHIKCESFLFPQSICTTTTAFLHFFFLASFCWVLTEAWQSYMAVTGKIRTRLIRKRFLCLGWGKHINIPFRALVKMTLNTSVMNEAGECDYPQATLSNLIWGSGNIGGWSYLNILWAFGTLKRSEY